MPIRLIPTSSGETIKLDKPVLLIGRNPDCDVVLTESRKVSRNHCLIACVDDKLFIRDLGSTNGVWINGHRVEREGRIRAGDVLSIADLKYNVKQVDRNGSAKPDKSGKPAPQQPVSDEHEAGGRRVRKVGIVAPPDGDQPVAIPEDDSFIIKPQHLVYRKFVEMKLKPHATKLRLKCHSGNRNHALSPIPECSNWPNH